MLNLALERSASLTGTGYDYSFDAVPLVFDAADLRLLLPVTAYLGFAILLVLSLGAAELHPGVALVEVSLLSCIMQDARCCGQRVVALQQKVLSSGSPSSC